jgi:lysophospholipase L1-like esterase
MLHVFLSAALLTAPADPGPLPPLFTLEDGDRVVLVGNTLIEREQRSGYWEAALTVRFPHKNITFRNLGWSGDTVFGIARASFDPPPVGFNRLRDGVLALKPTVLIVAYGGNESFEGAVGLSRFVAALETLLDVLAPTRARLVLVAPPRQENLGAPLPDPTVHNKDLQLYGDAIRTVAQKRGAVFVDLYAELDDTSTPLTDNGLHFTPLGYYRSARALEDVLGLTPQWRVTFSDSSKAPETKGVRVSNPVRSADGLRFAVVDESLPLVPPASEAAAPTWPWQPAPRRTSWSWLPEPPARLVRVDRLPPGRYTLRVDGQTLMSADASAWAHGILLEGGPDFDQAEQLRRAIIAKNRLYFHRWRPQNETYLFGFRKHEQGQNAREVPLFDPLVARAEQDIARLRVPTPHLYELTKEAGQ